MKMSQYDICIKCRHHVDEAQRFRVIKLPEDMARHYCAKRNEHTSTEELYKRPIYCEYGR